MAVVMDEKVKTWSPAVLCKISDNIVSSQFSSQKVFIPSYEREKRPCIEQLLTNEYQRIWWQEKEAWDKRHTSGKKTATKKLLQRKIIIRKKPTPAEKPTASVVKPKTIKKSSKKKEATAIKAEKKEEEEQREGRKDHKEEGGKTEQVVAKCSQENQETVEK